MRTFIFFIAFAFMAITLPAQNCDQIIEENLQLRQVNYELVSDYNHLVRTESKQNDSMLVLLNTLNDKFNREPSEFNLGFGVAYHQTNVIDFSASIYISQNYLNFGYITDKRFKFGVGQVFTNRWAADINITLPASDSAPAAFQTNIRYRVVDNLQVSLGTDTKSGYTVGLNYNI